MFFLLCDTLTVFTERIFLSHYSVHGVHASLNGTYLASIFQSPCVAIAAIGQVFVGFYQGSGELKRIGPCIWQLVWFSLFSLLITFPLGMWASSAYFKNTVIQQAGAEYFKILAFGNFLFPLNAALSSFYLGRGRPFFVTSLMLTSYALNLLFSWIFIFGIGGLTSLGIKGAALAKCIGLGFSCCVLFWAFLTKKNREVYETHRWQFSVKALWSYMHSGMVRAFGYLSSKFWWVAVSYLMIKKGGQYQDVLTIGGTLISFLAFTATGLYQAILTISSNLLGAKKYVENWRLLRSFTLYTCIIGAALAIPLFWFPRSLIYFFDASSQSIFKETFTLIHHWIWIYLIAIVLQMSLCALIVAARDLKLQFYCYLLCGLSSFLPVYLMMYRGTLSADRLWSIMSFENLILGAIFFFRFCQRNRNEIREAKNAPI